MSFSETSVGINNEQIEQIIWEAAHITPSPKQLAWHETEFNAFVHFTINTFTDKEWGEGTENPADFNPTDFNAHLWVEAFKTAGMKMVVLTAKHHDGFCLWPSRFTEHSVKNSPWRNGKGDVVREVSEACREAGLKFGIYLSPWDRHEPTYGDSPRYNEFFRNQLRELLTDYGEISEVWLDGACGEGPNGRVQKYDLEGYIGLIRQLQPQAVVMGTDYYIKDETGYGHKTEWMVMPRVIYPDESCNLNGKNTALAATSHTRPDWGGRELVVQWVSQYHFLLDWWPIENIVSIRPGWFYHAAQDGQVKSLDKLLDIYYCSVGYGGPLLLNIPPDRRGRIHENDVQRLAELGAVLRATFQADLARGAICQASNIRNNNPAYSPANVVDGDKNTYWMADDDITAAVLELDLGQEKTFNRVVLQEFIQRGQRIESFVIETWDGDNWQEVARATTVGYKRILRFADTTAQKVRLKIVQSRVCPTLSHFGLFYAPPTDIIMETLSKR